MELVSNTEQYDRYGLEKYLEVHQQGPVIDILKVKGGPLLEIGYLVTAVDLPQAGQAGTHTEPSFLPVFVQIYFAC
jgi:hypothetical protein